MATDMKRLGKYEVGRKLGSGNFSKVRLATDAETGQSYAMKIIDKSMVVQQKMEEQLRREITVMRKLKHPNIVRLQDVMQTNNHIYLIMGLATGGELFERIHKAGRLSEPVARSYFRQLMSGMKYCHDLGVAHRDIKPENLLLDAHDNLMITDFGLSNVQQRTDAAAMAAATAGGENNVDGNGVNGGVMSARALLMTTCGTPNYIAPEVLKERGYDGFKADIWSCGVVLYAMIAGGLPFDDPTLTVLFNKIERGEFRPIRSASPAANDLIARMLVVEPFRRIRTEEIMSHPWYVG